MVSNASRSSEAELAHRLTRRHPVASSRVTLLTKYVEKNDRAQIEKVSPFSSAERGKGVTLGLGMEHDVVRQPLGITTSVSINY